MVTLKTNALAAVAPTSFALRVCKGLRLKQTCLQPANYASLGMPERLCDSRYSSLPFGAASESVRVCNERLRSRNSGRSGNYFFRGLLSVHSRSHQRDAVHRKLERFIAPHAASMAGWSEPVLGVGVAPTEVQPFHGALLRQLSVGLRL